MAEKRPHYFYNGFVPRFVWAGTCNSCGVNC